jgi:hypothetical protein
MTVVAQLLIAAALVATAVSFGTDVFAAIVLRPALACVDDRTLTGATGYMHEYADRRRRGRWCASVRHGRLGAHLPERQRPINRQLTAAAHDGRVPGDARALRRQCDHVINAGRRCRPWWSPPYAPRSSCPDETAQSRGRAPVRVA